MIIGPPRRSECEGTLPVNVARDGEKTKSYIPTMAHLDQNRESNKCIAKVCAREQRGSAQAGVAIYAARGSSPAERTRLIEWTRAAAALRLEGYHQPRP